MKKLILSILLILVFPTVQAKPYFSNVIIFGDSLSDIGNFPESPKPFVSKNHPGQWHSHDELYYVPISNPVNRAGYKVDLKSLFSLNHAYPWPDTSEDHLAVPINRNNHSLGWAEFFVNYAHDDDVTPSTQIIPSSTLESNPIFYGNQFTSVDYAWVSATSIAQCRRFKDFKKVSSIDCTRQAILSARTKYIKDRSNKNFGNMIVPGVRRQEKLFITDVENKKVHVGPYTIYIIYVGGNDLINDYDGMSISAPDKLFSGLKNLAYNSSENVYLAALKLIDDPHIQAKHIYIVNLFDPNLTPAISEYNSLSQDISSLVTDYYDFELYRTVVELNNRYPNHLTLIHGYRWYQQMHNDTRYSTIFNVSNSGKACELSSKAYQAYYTPKTNCRGYLFWNSIHPSMAAQQIFAYWMEQAVKSSDVGPNI